ncbi:hypothetical protein ABZ949_02540 [Micromonospora tulbaghiae]|uniref:hypothetical protein n=1 Tax=Micromonospora tulbaghiae TaxID=479978 RepID=UPI0034100520
MGTNYYWRDQPCGSCGRGDFLHVGKHSGGWSFGFRGYRHDPDDGLYSPVGRSIVSRLDWRLLLADRPGRLVDEYGKQVDDPIAWLDAMVPPSAEQQQKEDRPQLRGPYAPPRGTDPREWRDAEGFRFYDGDFS